MFHLKGLYSSVIQLSPTLMQYMGYCWLKGDGSQWENLALLTSSGSEVCWYCSILQIILDIVHMVWLKLHFVGLCTLHHCDSTHRTILNLLTSRACRRKVLFSPLAHSMHSRHSSTSCPVAASMSRKRSSKERTSRAALALLMEIRKGLTNFSRPPNSGHSHKRKQNIMDISKEWKRENTYQTTSPSKNSCH